MRITAVSPKTADEVELELSVEADGDEGVYLALVGEADDEEVIELDIKGRNVQDFFRMVAIAQIAYDRQTL